MGRQALRKSSGRIERIPFDAPVVTAIRSERRGVEMRDHSRRAEVDGRCPGLLAAIIGACASQAGADADGAGAPSR